MEDGLGKKSNIYLKKGIKYFILLYTIMSEKGNTLLNPTQTKWTLWAHLPHDIDWTLSSYKKILEISSIEEIVILMETLPSKMIKNCMLFLMRENIKPMWEDTKNKDGGSFSYKVPNKNIEKTWCNLSYSLVGENLAKNSEIQKIINGITISPKKNFCVIKIWTSNCKNQDPSIITNLIDGINSEGCLFKKHNSNS